MPIKPMIEMHEPSEEQFRERIKSAVDGDNIRISASLVVSSLNTNGEKEDRTHDIYKVYVFNPESNEDLWSKWNDDLQNFKDSFKP